MKYPTLVFLLFLSAGLMACSYQYAAQTADRWVTVVELKPHHRLQRSRTIALPAKSHICFANVGVDEVDFQRQLDEDVFTALQTYFVTVHGISNVKAHEGAISSAWEQGCELLFYLTVLRQDDQVWSVTEWGEGQVQWADIGTDKLVLNIVIWDVNASAVLDSTLINSRTAWMDFYASQSEDLIYGALDLYLRQLVVVR